jgi:hypothetical protein
MRSAPQLDSRQTLPPGVREVLRYQKADRVRIYALSCSADAPELWVASGKVGAIRHEARRKVTFDPSDDVVVFLEDMERTLRCGGWTRLTP